MEQLWLVFQVFTPLLLLLLSSLHANSLMSPTSTSAITTDRHALLSFKSSISSDPRGSLASWNDSVHFCLWPGVTCGGRRHPERVVSLNMTSLDLVGFISPAIVNLTFLRKIDLSVNQIHGFIPQDISRLFRLRHLNLSKNSLEGGIPTSLSHCSKLKVIDFQKNNFRGEIPHSLGNCSSLQILSLKNNSLTGHIPPSLTSLSSLYFLSLSYNNLSGGIPPNIGNLFSLTVLGLEFNQLSGGIPSSLANITSLSVLDLSFNNLTGNIPPTMGSRTSLTILYLNNNGLSGHIPPTIGNLTSLTGLYLYNNELNGSIPPSLANLTSLTILDLSFNNLNGAFPPTMGNLTSLAELYLSNNELSGNISPTIGNLFSLTILDLGSNQLSGSIPASIGMLQKLHELDLDNNKLSGEIPSIIGNLTQLIYVYLLYNDLSGDIPASLGNCQNLEELNLKSNKLTGAVPKDIFTIYTLSIGLILASNLLTGLVPAEIGNLKNLGFIDLSMNNLSGEIPSSLSECEVLEGLYLGGNFFHGSIPTSFRSLGGMRMLDVSENKLSGKIPDFLQDFRDLYYLNLSFNNFEGEVPRLGVFQNASEVSVIGNNKLCGGNPGLHLPACFSQSPNKKHESHTLVLIFGITGSFLFLIIVFSFLIGRRRKKSSSRKPQESTPIKEQHEKVSYAELVKATNGFSTDNIIGTGSFGTVYKGTLDGDSRKVVAVKVLNLQTKGASKSFLAECEAMRNIRHRNLVKILTTCSSVDFRGNDFKALVSEFMDNGSLDNWLHPKASEQSQPKKLNIKQRLNIAVDVASALDYLHHQGDTPIIHCDLKPSNILLDGDMTAHVGDFGLSRLLNNIFSKSSQHSTSSAGLKGTVGYIAPEYGMANKVSTLGDVYSFGILLLEMFTTKRPTDDIFTAGLSLRKFVMMAFPERIIDVVDTHLLEDGEANDDGGNMTDARAIIECIVSMLGIGISCSNELPEERMEMGAVVRELHNVRDVFVKNGSQ